MNEIDKATRGAWTVLTEEEREKRDIDIAPDRSVTVFGEDHALLIADGEGDLAYLPTSVAVDALRRAGYVVYYAPSGT